MGVSTPDRIESSMNRYSHFRLTVTAKFAVQGRGTLVDGSLDWGVVNVGDSVEVHGGDGCQQGVITGMDLGPWQRQKPHQSQRIALLLRDIDADDVEPGDIVMSVSEMF